jgi:hypothetical protein
MKRMTFTLSVLSHVYTNLHILERLCCLRLIGVRQYVQSRHNERHVSGVIIQPYKYMTKDPFSLIGTRCMMMNI